VFKLLRPLPGLTPTATLFDKVASDNLSILIW